jgi:hypothetical protein
LCVAVFIAITKTSVCQIRLAKPENMTGYGNGNQVKPSTTAAAELKHWSGSQTYGGAGISVSPVLFWKSESTIIQL